MNTPRLLLSIPAAGLMAASALTGCSAIAPAHPIAVHGNQIPAAVPASVASTPATGAGASAAPSSASSSRASSTGMTPIGASSTSASSTSPTGASASPEASSLPAVTATQASARTKAKPAAASDDAEVDCARVKCVALTFDDGPGPYTKQILDTLEAHGAKATFFEVGQQVKRYPATVKRQAAMGMAIGNHTWSHADLTKLSSAAARREVNRTGDAIKDAGAPRPTMLRAPYGSFNSSTKALGLPLIQWEVDSLDWQNRSVRVTTHNIVKQVRPGDIVLMHDIVPSTAKALPGILDALQARGYHFVTVPQLEGKMKPGAVYHHGGDTVR